MSVEPSPSREPAQWADERKRVYHVEEGYSSDDYYARIWVRHPASRYILEQKWHLLERVLRDERIPVATLRMLDIGVGGGGDIPFFSRLGLAIDRIIGVDLVPNYLRRTKASFPGIMLAEATAARLPFAAGAFDFVYQSTVLSSIPAPELRAASLREIRRVLTPGGLFVSYDTRYPNPWNRNTRAVRLSELRAAFQGWPLRVWSTTGIPHLLRLFAPYSLTACRLLERIPFLRSHLLVAARKPRN
jgi:SAM-dependent methyltransferase